MSSPSTTPGSSSLPLGLGSIGKLFSARDGGEKVPSTLATIADTTITIRNAIMKTIAVPVSAGLGLSKALVALPNNLIGLLTTGIDRVLVRSIETTRHHLWRLMTSPKQYVMGGT